MKVHNHQPGPPTHQDTKLFHESLVGSFHVVRCATDGLGQTARCERQSHQTQHAARAAERQPQVFIEQCPQRQGPRPQVDTCCALRSRGLQWMHAANIATR